MKPKTKVSVLDKGNLGICIIICLHCGDVCKSCIKQKHVCFYLCVLLCRSVQHCVSGDSPEDLICPHDTPRPKLWIKETLIYSTESTYRTRLLNGETQGKWVQDEERNTLKASQQALAMAKEENRQQWRKMYLNNDGLHGIPRCRGQTA